ncbi:MAG: O-antigen ligase family protein, partial [Bryobacteraceae bacterium]|nr:O-antigen ligase family protein [Bryobacteraceae bacterium]
MGIRSLIVLGTVIGLCVLAPLRPVLGLYGYYWFAMMRPDILAWAGPNRYSLFLAGVTLFCNMPRILRNLPRAVLNPVLRNLALFLLVVTISVIVAVDPSLCTERYTLFLRVFLMSFVIPLILTTAEELKWFFAVLSGSLGLLSAKFGLYGILHGGAVFAEGYGGLLSDNNTMALAFAMAVPMCWYSRALVPWKAAKLGFAGLAVLALAATAFTHSRGGILAVGAGLFLVTISERRKLLAFGLLAVAGAGVAYLVWDSLSSRLSTLKDPREEASARSRIILAQSAPKLWLDYPFFGVGFTETNQQRLIFKYVPPEYAVEYSGKVLHNNWLQILVDSGIFAFLLYVWLVFSVGFRMWRRGRGLLKKGDIEGAAIPLAVSTALGVFIVGATFLSRTTFDLYYVLLCTAAAWMEIFEPRRAAAVAEPAPAAA